ncbi:MAG: methylmalonyl-CoA mutase small subunit [Bacteroidales bacterium]|nr:methylmalonyl-CoA mutase small subunit [Bacteroidales bacterium]
MSDVNQKLFSEFPPVSTQDWEAKIAVDLKGADYEKKLVWKTNEGIKVRPYYRAEDLQKLGYLVGTPGEFPFIRGKKTTGNDWFVRQDIVVENIESANKKALEILNKGITSLGFVLQKETELTKQGLTTLLKDICLGAVEVNFSGHGCAAVSELFAQYVKEMKYDNTLEGSFSYDPFGRLVKKGNFCGGSMEKSVERLTAILNNTASLPKFRAFAVNGVHFSNAGASVVQELGFALSMGAEYLNVLTEKGFSVAQLASKVKFNFGVSANYFMEIAKFRAARFLWAKMVEAYDPKVKEAMFIHAETTHYNLSMYDAYVNMLRTTTESMSAVIAGVDSLTVMPFDVTFEKPTDFAERIARNQQIILKEESYLDKIVDPSAGSYYIENLTDAIITEAWNLFLEVQNKGGFIAAVKEGFIQAKVKEVAQKRDMAIATRREIILGINQYPNTKEILTSKPDDQTVSCHCKDGKCDGCDDDCLVEPLNTYRGANAFEELRTKVDFSGRRPKVFMLTIGSLSMRLARSQFSGNFFGCAGFEILDNNGFKTVDEGVNAAFAAKADIVVLCSSDDEYAAFAPEALEKLGNKAILVVAGAPACQPELEAKGVKNFISMRSNVLETLKYFSKELNIN